MFHVDLSGIMITVSFVEENFLLTRAICKSVTLRVTLIIGYAVTAFVISDRSSIGDYQMRVFSRSDTCEDSSFVLLVGN